MDHLLSLLELTLWALHESGLWAGVVEVRGSGEGTTELRDFTGGFVNGDNITTHDFLFLDRLDHLGTKVVDSLHLSGFKSDLTGLGSRLNRLIDFNLNNLSLNNFSLLSYSDS